MRIPVVKSAMTPFPHTIEAQATLGQARSMMAAHRIRHLPVKEGASLVGIVSDRDIKEALGAGVAPLSGGVRLVRDAMAPNPYVVDLHEPLERVLLSFAERHLDCALVVKEGRLAGIFTSTDACRAYAEHLRAFREPAGDELA